jgi:hypothetical protein
VFVELMPVELMPVELMPVELMPLLAGRTVLYLQPPEGQKANSG